MKNLDKLRKKIDLIDNKILDLLKNRSKLSLNIGNLKNNNDNISSLYRPERQTKILRRLFLKKNSLIGERDILNFWKEIFFHQTNLQGGLEFLIPEFLKTHFFPNIKEFIFPAKYPNIEAKIIL